MDTLDITRTKLGLLLCKVKDKLVSNGDWLPPNIVKGSILTVISVGIGTLVKTSSGLKLVIMADYRYSIQ